MRCRGAWFSQTVHRWYGSACARRHFIDSEPSHQGASAAICAARDVPLCCAEAERELAENGQVTRAYPKPADPVARFQQRYWAGPGWPAARTLREGDAVSDFCVIETPGHAPATWHFGAGATAYSSRAMCW
jgi:hypothetical protein